MSQCLRNHHPKFKIYGTSLKCLNDVLDGPIIDTICMCNAHEFNQRVRQSSRKYLHINALGLESIKMLNL